jgi:hypothetical protein
MISNHILTYLHPKIQPRGRKMRPPRNAAAAEQSQPRKKGREKRVDKAGMSGYN